MRSFFVVGTYLLWYNEKSSRGGFKAEFVEESPCRETGERALPGRGPAFLEKYQGTPPGPLFYLSARPEGREPRLGYALFTAKQDTVPISSETPRQPPICRTTKR